MEKMTDPKMKERYFNELYNVYVDIERKFLKNECKNVEKAEVLLLFTRNQFIRELQNMMDNDEGKTLKY